MNWEDVTKALEAPLSPDAIKPPPAGKFGEYVDGLHVIREANRIFGFNGWSYEVTRLEQTSNGTFELKGKNGPYTQFRCSFLCSVKVTVDGVYREGTAVGMGSGKPESAGDVIESAVKEAETDALKRAMRTFGNTFGLALYEKDRSKREVGFPEPEPLTPEQVRDRITAYINGNVMLSELSGVWLDDETMKSDMLSLPDDMRDAVNMAYRNKVRSGLLMWVGSNKSLERMKTGWESNSMKRALSSIPEPMQNEVNAAYKKKLADLGGTG